MPIRNPWWRRQLKQLQVHFSTAASGKVESSNGARSASWTLSKPTEDSQTFISVLRSAKTAWSRSSREYFFLWIRGRPRNHFGPTCRLPDLFQRRDQAYFALETRRLNWHHAPPPLYHDLIDCAAKVGALEVRLGYTFKNRMLGINALKNTADTHVLYFSGQIYDVSKNQRLALLGDRTMESIICEMWYKAGYPIRMC